MHDDRIIELYFARDEQAIRHTADKYGAYCTAVSMNILHSEPDAEECVNDTYLKTWNSMPPPPPPLCGSFSPPSSAISPSTACGIAARARGIP